MADPSASQIVNFFESVFTASASEYIKKGGLTAQITQHFLGSGIYGFIDWRNAKAYHGDLSAYSARAFELSNPFIIPDGMYKEIFEDAFLPTMSTLCRYLTRLDLLIRSEYSAEIEQNRTAPEFPYPTFRRYINGLVSSISVFDSDLCMMYFEIQNGMATLVEYGYELMDLNEVIAYFLTDYYWADDGDFICAPTNYMLGFYDGVYFEGDGDTGRLGSVYFNWWDAEDMSPPRHYKKAFDSDPFLDGQIVFAGKVVYNKDKE